MTISEDQPFRRGKIQISGPQIVVSRTVPLASPWELVRNVNAWAPLHTSGSETEAEHGYTTCPRSHKTPTSPLHSLVMTFGQTVQ